MNQKIIIKYGGAAMDEPALTFEVARRIAAFRKRGDDVVVVHGGGKEVTRHLERLQIQSHFVNGLRYTDAETLEAAEMLLSGTINKRIVSMIQQAGEKAIGLSGRDGRIAQITRLPELGFVGAIESISPELLELLLSRNYIPVVSPISEEDSGQAVNVNADEMARAIASGLSANTLIFLTDVDGLLLEGKLVHRCPASEIEKLLKHPEVKGGMIPKLEGALQAIRGGVSRVLFLNGKNPELLDQVLVNGLASGTEIYNDR